MGDANAVIAEPELPSGPTHGNRLPLLTNP